MRQTRKEKNQYVKCKRVFYNLEALMQTIEKYDNKGNNIVEL